ncbi:MAG: hypothetical protein IJS94_07865 [Clostridia bacterium]|nr:hypothetical protein [Clostridia bacterium]
MDRLEILNRDVKLIRKARTVYRGAKFLTASFFTTDLVIAGRDFIRFLKK